MPTRRLRFDSILKNNDFPAIFLHRSSFLPRTCLGVRNQGHLALGMTLASYQHVFISAPRILQLQGCSVQWIYLGHTVGGGPRQ
jgi:hypothetical protein